MMYVMLLVGFLLLIKGADLFVDGSATIAKIWKVPTLIIGLTIVAMGTSAPEASVSITASLSGNNEIAIGNVVGSNIFNGMIVVGVCAMMGAFVVDHKLQKRDLPVALGSSILLMGMMADGKLSRLEGVLLLASMVLYIGWAIHDALASRKVETMETVNGSPLQCFIWIVIGLAMIILGGNLVVDNASAIAAAFGVSQNLIALTIVAIGTSLPELVTSITASRKGEHGLALGNAIGSNIFNILFILGASAVLSPISIALESIADTAIMIFITCVLFYFAVSRNIFSKKEGLCCVVIYLLYTVYIFIR